MKNEFPQIVRVSWDTEAHAHSNLSWIQMNMRHFTPRYTQIGQNAIFIVKDKKQKSLTKRFIGMCGGKIEEVTDES